VVTALGGHWRGAIVVANGLRDAGMEVVYLGHASSAEIANTVVQEDAMLVGLSCLSGNHLAECPPVMQAYQLPGRFPYNAVLGDDRSASLMPRWKSVFQWTVGLKFAASFASP
jgi:methylmalonyl-CoA mutase cobalamin-binding domain/chain